MPKRKILPILAIALLLTATAATAQVRRGVEAAFNLTGLHMKQDLVTVNNVPGFKVGFTIESMFPGIGFGINTGAYYSLRGANMKLGEKKCGQPTVMATLGHISITSKFLSTYASNGPA